MKSSKDHGNNDDHLKNYSAFECSICLDTARDAVVSMCGHLFCWPCLYQWLYATNTTNTQTKTCPVCKSAISSELVIPIYGRGADGSNKQDPRDKLPPPRPSGHRTEVPNQQNHFPYGTAWGVNTPGAHVFGFGDGGFQLFLGFGGLPQFILALIQEFTANDRQNGTDFLMKLFAFLGSLVIVLMLLFC